MQLLETPELDAESNQMMWQDEDEELEPGEDELEYVTNGLLKKFKPTIRRTAAIKKRARVTPWKTPQFYKEKERMLCQLQQEDPEMFKEFLPRHHSMGKTLGYSRYA